MPRLSYRATNFPAVYGNALAGDQTLDFTWTELVWAAISVGRAELLHLLRFGPFSAFEIVYRSALLFANLKETPSTDITRSEAYEGLDPSEKGAVSYFMGLTAAKLLADRLLDVPWLMHLDVYRQQLQPVLQHGGNRPDLVGRTTAGQWVAIESKGRTHGHDQRALERAKEQVQALITISGAAPSLRVALLAHFSGGLLQCAIDDPEDEGRSKPIDLPLSEPQLHDGYYRPFREWLREMPGTRREVVTGLPYRVAELPEVDLTVGLQERLIERAEAPDAVGVHQSRISEQGFYVGVDGILVRAGTLWSVENMRREPQERRRA